MSGDARLALALVELESSQVFEWLHAPPEYVIALAPDLNRASGVIVSMRERREGTVEGIDRFLLLCSRPIATGAHEPLERARSRLASGVLDAPRLRDELDRFIERAREEKLDLYARKELRVRASLLIAMASDALSGGDGQRDRQILDRLVAYVDANLGASLKVGDLCQVSRLSVAQLSRLFGENLGTTAAAYVLNRRLEVARTLVEQKQSSLGEIAYAAGFSSQGHFTAAFKARWGVTPGKLKRGASDSSTIPVAWSEEVRASV